MVYLSAGAVQLGAAIRARGLSVNKAGDLVGAAKGAVSRLLRAERMPELKLAVALRDHFGVPVDAWLQPADAAPEVAA